MVSEQFADGDGEYGDAQDAGQVLGQRGDFSGFEDVVEEEEINEQKTKD
jgi:hypothetical protein